MKKKQISKSVTQYEIMKMGETRHTQEVHGQEMTTTFLLTAV